MATKKKTTTKKKSTKSNKKSTKKSAKKTTNITNKKENKKEEETKNANPWTILVICLFVIAIFLIGSALLPGYLKQQKVDKNRYNEFNLIEDEMGFWYLNLEINGKPTSVVFRNHPIEVDTIMQKHPAQDIINYLSKRVKADKQATLYLTFDPDESEEMNAGFAIASVEIARITGEKFDIYNIPTKGAITKKTEGTGAQTAIITCEDVTPSVGVIYMKQSDKDLISVPKPNCIMLEATNSSEMIKVADRLMYGLFGVINS